MANIIAYVELVDDQASWASLLTLRQGRSLATRMGATLYAVLPCASPPLYGDNDIIAVLSRQGADKVILMTHAALAEPAVFHGHGDALLTAISQFPPALLLLPAGPAASDLAPRVAARMGALFVSCPRLEVNDKHHLLITQSTHQGTHVRCFSTAELEHCVVAVVVPDPQRYPRAEGSEEAEVVVLSPGLKAPLPPAEPIPTEAVFSGLTERVVLVGSAVSTVEAWALVREFARRMAADLRQTPGSAALGLAPDVPVLGVSPPGTLPGLMLALGARGEDGSALFGTCYLIAVHPDRDAPIFRHAQFALVAEISEAVAEMLMELEHLAASHPETGSTGHAPATVMEADDTLTLRTRGHTPGGVQSEPAPGEPPSGSREDKP